MSEDQKKRLFEDLNDGSKDDEGRDSKLLKTDKDTVTNIENIEEKEVKQVEKVDTNLEKVSEETKESKDTEDTEDTKGKPSFVFGSTTPFGQMGGFKMFGAFSKPAETEKKLDTDKEGVDKINEKDEKKDFSSQPNVNNSNSKPIFGSGSTFGNAFQAAISSKSVFDEIKPSTNDEKENSKKNDDNEEQKKNDNEKPTEEVSDSYKTVHLEKQEVKSGEENEETLFQIKAKLYHMELSNAKEGWKERGFGVIKVNKFKNLPDAKYTSRIVMRQNGNLKLILNVPIIKEFKILKGMPSSLMSNKFIRLQLIENGEPVQYAIKIGQPENAEKLFDKVQEQIPGNDS